METTAGVTRNWRRIRVRPVAAAAAAAGRRTDEDAGCTSVMSAAFSFASPSRDSGRALRIEQGHQLGQC